jgi:hypothetical protein
MLLDVHLECVQRTCDMRYTRARQMHSFHACIVGATCTPYAQSLHARHVTHIPTYVDKITYITCWDTDIRTYVDVDAIRMRT